LPADHRAWQVRAFVVPIDLSGSTAAVKARAGEVGRPAIDAIAIDPRLLQALWLYATLHGVGSARLRLDCAQARRRIVGCAAGSL
jgi:hypothetical protein